jgi:hypothetical protein
MKIRIEGCTTEELTKHSPYLSLGKVYEAEVTGLQSYEIIDEDGDSLTVLGPHYGGCAFLPKGATWVEVAECCTPSEEDLQLLREGSYTTEELWGGSRPTCPECIDK